MLRDVKKSYAIWNRLRFRYRLFLGIPMIIGIAALFPAMSVLSQELAHAFGVRPDAPVNNQPNGLLWLITVLFVLWALAAVGALFGNVALAIGLRIFGGWSWEALRRVFLHCDVPKHWLIDRKK